MISSQIDLERFVRFRCNSLFCHGKKLNKFSTIEIMSFLSCFRCISKGSKLRSTKENETRFNNELLENTSPTQPRSSTQKQSKKSSASGIRYNPRTEQVSFEENGRDIWNAPTSNQIYSDNVSALYATVDKLRRSQNIDHTSEDLRQTSTTSVICLSFSKGPIVDSEFSC